MVLLFAKEKSSLQSTTPGVDPATAASSGGGKSNQKKAHFQTQQKPSKQSNNTSTTKKAKETPLRKSDRRQLLQRVFQVLEIPAGTEEGQEDGVREEDTNGKNGNAGHEEEQQQQQQGPRSNEGTSENQNASSTTSVIYQKYRRQLEHIFLKGTLTQRTLVIPSSTTTTTADSKKKSDKKVFVYYRGPDTETTETTTNEPLLWPYQQSIQPIWIEVDHEQSLQLPTVALLSAFTSPGGESNNSAKNNNPDGDGKTLVPIVPTTIVVFPNVSRYLCRGADLMKAGIAKIITTSHPEQQQAESSPNQIKKQYFQQQQQRHRVCAVQIQGNPQPLAVGLLSNNNLVQEPWGPGTQGVAAYIYTCYGDDLWRQQLPQTTTSNTSKTTATISEFDFGNYGNPGFVEGTVVVPLQTNRETDDFNEEEEPDTESSIHKDRNGSEAEAKEGDRTLAAEENPQQIDQQAEEKYQSASVEEEEKESPPSLSPEEILHQATCRALVRLHPKRDLPLNMAVFYSQHVLKQAKEEMGMQIQLKQTRYKKFGTYIQEQIDRSLLVVGPDAQKKDPLAMLVSYDARHPDLIPYVQEKRQEQAAPDGTNGASEPGQRKRLVLVDLYRVPQHFPALLRLDQDAVQAANATSAERRGTGYLTMKEVRAIVDNYVDREGLVDPQHQSRIILDGPLTDALFQQKKKKKPILKNAATTPATEEEPLPTTLSRKELATAWQGKMETAYAMVEIPGNHVVHLGRGAPPKVTIEVTRRQTKKFLTRVRGMEQYSVNAQELRQQLAHRFACAVALEEGVPGIKPQCAELQLQGNMVDEVEALLVGDPSLTDHGGAKDSPYQLPPNAMEIILRKGVPARKNRGGGKGAPKKK